MRKLVIFFILSVFVTLGLGAQGEEVGRLVSITGDVKIDAFGRNSFINAIINDVLYEKTSIKTGPESTAEILIADRQFTVPPGSFVRMVDYLLTVDKRKRSRWFEGFMNILDTMTNRSGRGGEKVVLGTRAADVASQDSTATLFEDEDEIFYKNAQRLIEEGEYERALEDLQAIDLELSFTLEPIEVYYQIGFCQFLELSPSDRYSSFRV